MSRAPGNQIEAARQLSSKDLIAILYDRAKKNPLDPDLAQGIASLHTHIQALQSKTATEEPTIPPEATASYWAEKLKKSGQYGLYPGSYVDPDWDIGGKKAGELYPWSVGSGQKAMGPQPYFEHLNIIRGEILVGANARKHLHITKQVNYRDFNPPSLLIVPESYYGNGFRGKPLPGSDGESSYLIYSHTLNNGDTHGRSGNELGLIMYLSKADTEKFVAEVEKDPHLLDGMLQELYPNLVGQKRPLRREKSDELIVAEYMFTDVFAHIPVHPSQTIKLSAPLGEI